MNKEFTQAEYDLLTLVSDEPETFNIIIDGADQVVMMDKRNNKPVHSFGVIGVDLIAKLFKSENIDIVKDDNIRVLEKC